MAPPMALLRRRSPAGGILTVSLAPCPCRDRRSPTASIPPTVPRYGIGFVDFLVSSFCINPTLAKNSFVSNLNCAIWLSVFLDFVQI